MFTKSKLAILNLFTEISVAASLLWKTKNNSKACIFLDRKLRIVKDNFKWVGTYLLNKYIVQFYVPTYVGVFEWIHTN